MKNVTKVSDNHYKVKMTQSDIKGLMDYWKCWCCNIKW